MTIYNSYKYNDKDLMEYILNNIRKDNPNSFLLSVRDNQSLINEWVAHNRLYKLGLFRTHTVTVDLDYPQKWYYKFGYWLLSL